MLIRIRRSSDAHEHDVTPEGLYLNRRAFMTAGAAFAAAAAVPAVAASAPPPAPPLAPLGPLAKSRFSTAEAKTPYDTITHYNNFYEFGLGKEDPSRHAHSLRPRPWSLVVDGEVLKPRTFDVDALLHMMPLEERIYRLRCVEGWSIVVPWAGFPLKALLDRVEPTAKGKYLAFETLYDPRQMPGQRSSVLKWPYREGLRLDEAVHPLTILAVGLYGKALPNQDGAPIRLVVPWKYGFKSIKSIVRIRLVERQPVTAWNQSAPDEYGFYANVNPAVDHPRWSQAKERRLGDFLRRETLPFNGYGEEVASLYSGMDLRRSF